MSLLFCPGGGVAKLFDPAAASISSSEAQDEESTGETSKDGDENLSVFIFDPASVGVSLCGGIIGTKGSVCIKPFAECTVAAHKTKVEISSPTLFITYAPMEEADRVYLTPTLPIESLSGIAVDTLVSQIATKNGGKSSMST